MASNRVHELSLQHVGPGRGVKGSNAELGAVVDVLDHMGAAARAAAGTDAQREKVDSVLSETDQPFAELRNVAVGGGGIADAAGPMLDVLDAMSRAVRAAGATQAQMRSTNNALDKLRNELG